MRFSLLKSLVSPVRSGRFISNSPVLSSIDRTLKCQGYINQNENYANFLLRNKIITADETPDAMFERVATALSNAGKKYYGKDKTDFYFSRFYRAVRDFDIILSTPIYTNAGRHHKKSFSACAVPTVNFQKVTVDELRELVKTYHINGMGTGFNFDSAADPVEKLLLLNQFAVDEVHNGLIERPVGNMGILSVEHPKAIDFSAVKSNYNQIDWKFNISLNLTSQFMRALETGESFISSYGHPINAKHTLRALAKGALNTGDPGIVFMDRYEKSNKTPQFGNYVSVAPCSEVPLLSGEVCHFGYLNLFAHFQNGQIQYDKLRDSIDLLVMMLDNAIEISIETLPKVSGDVIRNIRKIGLGICGFSDLLAQLGIPYDSHEAVRIAEDLMSFINFYSKKSSIELAIQRGPFLSYHHRETRRDLILAPFIGKGSRKVVPMDWEHIEQMMKRHGIRNSSTVILPPTGRSSLMAGVSAAIEPYFKLVVDDKFKTALAYLCHKHNVEMPSSHELEIIAHSGTMQNTLLPEAIKNVFKTCLEISPAAHMKMISAFQKFTDESISKTVNMPESTNVDEVEEIFKQAYDSGLKGISIYVDKCREFQPKQLAQDKRMENKAVSYRDPIYGAVKVMSPLNDILDLVFMQRLKSIHQNGIAYMYNPSLSATRFQHVMGVMYLVQRFGGDLLVQACALLHDSLHTAFSHVIDVVIGNSQQNYHEKRVFSQQEKSQLRSILSTSNLDCDAVLNYKTHPLLRTEPGELSCDNLDYFLRDGYNSGLLSLAEAQCILQSLVVIDGVLQCQSVEAAKFVATRFLTLNTTTYLSPLAEGNTLIFAEVVKALIADGDLSIEDFNKDEAYILEKISYSEYQYLLDSIQNQMAVEPSENGEFEVTRKLRYIDPRVASHAGQKLSEIDPEFSLRLDAYLSQPTTMRYDLNPRLNMKNTMDSGRF